MATTDPIPEQIKKYTLKAGFQEQKVAKVYAEALLNASEKSHKTGDVTDELRSFVEDLFQDKPDFEAFLTSAAIGVGHKKNVLQKTFQGKCSDVFYNFLMVLAEHDRLNIIRSVWHAFRDLDNKRNRRIPIKVTSAVPMTDDQKNQLYEKISTGFRLQPIMDYVVNEDILGGLIIQFGDWVFDASVRGELEKLRKQLLSRSSHEIQSGRDRFSTPVGD